MAVRLNSLLSPINNTDANFRAWINEIHNSLIAFGWLQTSDSGQINFSTVTRPTAVDTYQGYAIYKMNDVLQTACPFYMRIDFGTAHFTDDPGIKIQGTVGGTDGAGNLTGNLTTVLVTNANLVGAAGALNCRSSGTSSAFRMSFWAGAGAGSPHGWTFAVERDKDVTGTDTSRGICLLWCFSTNNTGSAVSIGSWFLETLGGSLIDTNRWYGVITPNSSQTAGGTTGAGHIRVPFGHFRNPITGFLMVARGDWVNESQDTIVVYGFLHNYVIIRPSGSALNLNGWNSDCSLAMLWE